MDDALGLSTPTDAVADEAGPSFAEDFLEALVVLPGAEHVVVVDASGQRILAEWGEPEGSTLAVLDRARRAADTSRTGRRELEDIASTTASAFHLSCFVLAGADRPESVWVGLRVSRSRGNLTWSKGALTRLNGLGGRSSPVTTADEDQVAPVADDPGVTAPAPSVVSPPARPAPAPTAVSAPSPPAPATPVASPTPAPVPAPAPAAPKARIALTARTVPLTFTAPGAPERVPATPDAADATPEADGDPDTAATAIVEPATTVEMATPSPVVPAARTSSENSAAPSTSAPQRQSSFAPVMVVLPPPAPIPDDGTFEEPAPMPAPMIVAPDLPVAGRPLRTEDTAAAPAAPPRPVASGTTAPTHEPTITRRLFHGLRRRP